MITRNKLYRIINQDTSLSGVCLGLEEYFNTDVTVFRLMFVLTFFFTPIPSFWIYLILALVLPVKPNTENETTY